MKNFSSFALASFSFAIISSALMAACGSSDSSTTAAATTTSATGSGGMTTSTTMSSATSMSTVGSPGGMTCPPSMTYGCGEMTAPGGSVTANIVDETGAPVSMQPIFI